MKHSLLALLIPLTFAPAIAYSAPNTPSGNFSGVCRIDRASSYAPNMIAFNVKPGEEATIGFYTNSGEYEIKVVNDFGSPFPTALGIGIGNMQDDINGGITRTPIVQNPAGPNDQIFRNPPHLCPTNPLSDRSECELANKIQNFDPVAVTKILHSTFELGASQHSIPSTLVEDQFDRRLKIKTSVEASREQATPGYTMTTSWLSIDGVTAGCSGQLE